MEILFSDELEMICRIGQFPLYAEQVRGIFPLILMQVNLLVPFSSIQCPRLEMELAHRVWIVELFGFRERRSMDITSVLIVMNGRFDKWPSAVAIRRRNW